MQIGDSIALVTGANRGLGLAFARELVRRGAARVYGAARRQDQVTEPGVTPVGLDITDQAQVAAAAARCGDVSLLVNSGPKDSPEDVVSRPWTRSRPAQEGSCPELTSVRVAWHAG